MPTYVEDVAADINASRNATPAPQYDNNELVVSVAHHLARELMEHSIELAGLTLSYHPETADQIDSASLEAGLWATPFNEELQDDGPGYEIVQDASLAPGVVRITAAVEPALAPLFEPWDVKLT